MLQSAKRIITTRKIDAGADSGLVRHTVRRLSRQLTAAGWSSVRELDSSSAAACLPVHLLVDKRVGAQARVLYGSLQALPKYSPEERCGKFTYTRLSKLTGTGINTLKRAISDLTRTGWLCAAQKHSRAPIEFVLGNPMTATVDAWIKRAQWRIKRSQNRGEAIMQEYLSLLIDSDNYQDNVKLGILTNPMTGERMEFDRFYPPSVAFEFQGPQHFGSTDEFSQKEVADQMARDLMKLGICVKKRIALVEIRREDLSLGVMEQKIGNLLPLRDLTGLERLIRYVEAVAQSYRSSEAGPRRVGGAAPLAGARRAPK